MYYSSEKWKLFLVKTMNIDSSFIFITCFSICSIFLFYLNLNRYGEAEKLTDKARGFSFSLGVNCYSSMSLGGPWRFEGQVLGQSNIWVAELSDKDRPFIIERPKVHVWLKFESWPTVLEIVLSSTRFSLTRQRKSMWCGFTWMPLAQRTRRWRPLLTSADTGK